MARCLFLFSAVLSAVLGLGIPVSGQVPAESVQSGSVLKAGLAKLDITPDKPVKMSGYSGRKAESTGVHDRLSARITAFASGGRRLVLVSTDLIGFYDTYEPIRDAICERYQLKPDEILLTGTHTHSGPSPTLSADGYPNNVEYTQSLKGKLLEESAGLLKQRARSRWGSAGAQPVGVNRRERQPDGSIKAWPQSVWPDRQGGAGDEAGQAGWRARWPRCSITQRTARRSDPETSRSAATFWGSPQWVEKIRAGCDRARLRRRRETSTPGFGSYRRSRPPAADSRARASGILLGEE